MECRVKECWNLALPGSNKCVMHTQAPCKVTIVAGPPCSGKSTWVREHAKQGDLIVDWDALMAALSTTDDHTRHETLLPFVADARDAVMARLTKPSQVAHAWVVTSNPEDVLKVVPGAEVHHMETTAEECLARLEADPDGRNVREAAAAIRSQ